MDKEFQLENLLQKVTTKKINLKKGDCPTSPSNEYNIPARTATTTNQGLSCYVPETEATVLKNMISVSANGDFCAFWHDEKFTILQDAYALKGKGFTLNREIALYIIGTMYTVLAPKYNWNNKSGWEKIKTECITLPIKTDENGNPIIDDTHFYHEEGFIPDFDYMQERIEELEQERIEELEQYLVATGLNDYELTDEDIEVLSLSGFGHYEERDNEDVVKVRKEFKVSDLFESFNGDIDLQKKDINGKGFDVVSSGLENNGIIGRTDIDARIFNNNTITIDMFGNCFYRDEQYKMVTHARVFSLSPLFDGLNNVNGQYIVSQFKYLPTVYNYSNMCSFNKIKDDKLSLPIQTDEENNPIIDTECKYHPDGYIPDWDFMNKYIKAIKKIVIADVVQYKDAMISKTKEVVA